MPSGKTPIGMLPRSETHQTDSTTHSMRERTRESECPLSERERAKILRRAISAQTDSIRSLACARLSASFFQKVRWRKRVFGSSLHVRVCVLLVSAWSPLRNGWVGAQALEPRLLCVCLKSGFVASRIWLMRGCARTYEGLAATRRCWIAEEGRQEGGEWRRVCWSLRGVCAMPEWHTVGNWSCRTWLGNGLARRPCMGWYIRIAARVLAMHRSENWAQHVVLAMHNRKWFSIRTGRSHRKGILNWQHFVYLF